MAIEYKKYGVTTGGYRGERAVLKERVIEGFDEPTFIVESSDEGGVLRLTADSAQTIHLTSQNVTSDSQYIILPDATTLFKNWRTTIINDSPYDCSIYLYSNSQSSSLVLFKEITKGNMTTCILLDDTLPAV